MLPGLATPHTRASYYSASIPESSGSRLHIEKIVDSPDDFILASETGLWLLPPHVAEKDVEQDIARAGWLANEVAGNGGLDGLVARYRRITHILGRSSIDAAGCVGGGLRGKQTPATVAIELAEFEMRAPSNNSPEDVPYICLCGNEDCYNSRHFNFDFGASRVDQIRVELNPYWYKTQSDGTIETIWGDELPSVETSLRYFFEFQRRFFPFVPYAESSLTPTPVSQIGFQPMTGCWESYMYEKNTPGLVNVKNGYGVMYARQEPDTVNPETGEVRKGYRRGSVLAHNLIWSASGRELVKGLDRNHLCNYPRCCNPLHIEQIDPEENRKHGHAARSRIRLLERTDPQTKDAMLTAAQLAELNIPVRQRYAELEASLTDGVII